MKIDARRIAAVLADPGQMRVILLYGEDAGLVRERAAGLVKTVLGPDPDPFCLAELTGKDAIEKLEEEATSLALSGGRRVVRVRDAGNALAGALDATLKTKFSALLVLEAGALAARDKLRVLAERAADVAAIACYPDEGRALEDVIRDGLAGFGVKVEPDALHWLAAHMGADRAITRQEVEKLALYVGQGGTATMADAEACAGDATKLSLDDALFAATAGDVAGADRALRLAIGEGAMPVQVIRAAIRHMQRLHEARLSGLPPGEAAEKMRIFFRRKPAFLRALGLWPTAGLTAALAALGEAERACKRTGAADEAIVQQTILTIARRSAAAATAR